MERRARKNQDDVPVQAKPTVSRRERQKARTRSTLIKAAADHFAQTGLRDARTEDIARLAAVSHGTVFAHFPTKAALVEETIGQFASALTARLDELAREGAGLRDLLSAHLTAIGEVEALYQRILVDLPGQPATIRAYWVTIQSAISKYFAPALEASAAKGRAEPLDPALTFNTWQALLHHYLANRELFAPDGSVIDRYGPRLIDHFEQLIDPSQTEG